MRLRRLLRLDPSPSGPQPCRCGHEGRAHEHYRRGTDCGLCTCPKFKAGRSQAAPRDGGAQGARGERAHAA